MAWNRSNHDSLRRVFREGFVAGDVAEPLVSFDATTSCSEAVEVLNARGFDVAGVRREGLAGGYAERSELTAGSCGDHLRAFDESDVVPESMPLAHLVLRLARSPRLFVRVLGSVSGIVTLDDLQKPPVRMWLFGMVTIIEMRMTRLIERFCPDDAWRQFLSASRLEKAGLLQEERRKRNQNPGLLDCLQFSDQGQIVARTEAIRGLTRFASRRQVEQMVRALESLRNSLAHSQDIVSCDWRTIVALSEDIDRVVAGTEQVQAALGETS